MSIQLTTRPTAGDLPEVVFHVKGEIAFSLSTPLSEAQQKGLAGVLKGCVDGPYAEGDWAEVDGKLFLIMDTSKEKHFSRLENLKLAAYRLTRICEKRQFGAVTLSMIGLSFEEASAILHGIMSGDYRFEKYKSKPKAHKETRFDLVCGERLEPMQILASQIAAAMEQVHFAKDLVNEPGSALTPQQLVAYAVAQGKKHNLTVKVRNATQLEKEGYMGLISVGKGSPHSPAMVVLEYNPRKARPNVHLGLLGKGLTFDTGGISLKPATDMWEMKMDMAGAAAALAGICAISSLKLPIRTSAVLCIAENRPSGAALLPGDIFTAKNGKTVMVDNTDAEGRLVLTDGLWECGSLGVTHLVDLATLTGAIIRALGTSVAGLFSNSNSMAELVLQSGQSCGEKYWPMPLEMEYFEGLKDKVADLKNVSGEVGAITAALFLNEFVPSGTAWAHLDIAGTAFTKKTWKTTEHGATGFGVLTLVEIAKRLSDTSRNLPDAPPANPDAPSTAKGRRPKARNATPVPRSTHAPRRGRPPKNSSAGMPSRRGRPRKNPPQG